MNLFEQISNIYKNALDQNDKKHILYIIYQTLYRMEKGSIKIDEKNFSIEADIFGKEINPVILYTQFPQKDNYFDSVLLSLLFSNISETVFPIRFVVSDNDPFNMDYPITPRKIIRISYGQYLLKDNVLMCDESSVNEALEWVYQL